MTLELNRLQALALFSLAASAVTGMGAYFAGQAVGLSPTDANALAGQVLVGTNTTVMVTGSVGLLGYGAYTLAREAVKGIKRGVSRVFAPANG